jgi:hypothetical protein
MSLCLAAWAEDDESAFRLGYVQEAVTFGKLGPKRVVADVFLRNQSGVQQGLHFVHRRAITPEVLTETWLDVSDSQTARFLALFDGGLRVDRERMRLVRDVSARASKCVEDLLNTMPSDIALVTDADVSLDLPKPVRGREKHAPFTSFTIGPLPANEEWLAVRFGFDLSEQLRSDLALQDARTRRYGVEGPRVLVGDIGQLDLPAVPRKLREEFAEYGTLYEKLRGAQVTPEIYDVVMATCNPDTRVVRFDTHARRLCVPESLEKTTRWWRAEADDFVIQVVEPDR